MKYDFLLVKNGYRLNVMGTDTHGRRAGMFLEAPVPYQNAEGFQRDYWAEVERAKTGIVKALAAMPQVKVKDAA